MFMVAVLMSACGPGDSKPAVSDSGRPRVFTANYPLHWMAAGIAGDRIELLAPWVGEGDPAYWEPDASAIAEVQSCSLILLNGATYEQWRGGVTLPESRLVLTASGFSDRWIEVEDAVVHSHGPEGDHSHAGTAFTTWLDLSLAREQLAAVHKALAGILPEDTEALKTAYEQMDARLASLDEQLSETAAGLRDKPLLGSHPVYQYLAGGYDLDIVELHWEPGSDPGESEWTHLAGDLENRKAVAMLWEGKPSDSNVAKLKELGVKSVVFSPCGDKPGSDSDFLSVMESNIKNLASLAQ
jgi:zinc transport system substrate-binding protein